MTKQETEKTIIRDPKSIVLNYLENKKLLHIDMIEPIKRNTCDILYADNDGALIYEKNSEAYMLSTKNTELATRLIEKLSFKGLFVIHQKELFSIVKEKFRYKNYFECKNVAYLSNIPPKLSNSIEIR